jgi:flagellar assembly protein FliH
MTSSSDLATAGRRETTVVRGGDLGQLRPARLDADLRDTGFVTARGADPRLFDPSLVRVVAEAAAIAEDEARTAGWEAGYRAGSEAGQRAAQEAAAVALQSRQERELADRQDWRQRVAASLEALAVAAAGLEQREAVVAEEVERHAVDLAVDLAEALVGHHLRVGDCGARDALARALSLAPEGAAATVRLHPDDAAALVAETLPATGRSLTLVADPTVEVGGCVVDCGPRRIDAQTGPALRRVREVLGT